MRWLVVRNLGRRFRFEAQLWMRACYSSDGDALAGYVRGNFTVVIRRKP